MTRLRTGFLSDENMKKMCSEHRPIPMNRLDLLPRPMENRSGLYNRALKQPQILSRPASAKIMLDSTQKLTGKSLSEDYKKALETEKKLPMYPKVLPPSTQSAQPIYGSFRSQGIPLADVTYAQLTTGFSIPSMDDLGSEASGFVFDVASVDTPSISETQSMMEAREELMGSYQIREEDPEQESYVPFEPPDPEYEEQIRMASYPRTPSILGPELQQSAGRGRPPTVTVPEEVVRQIREFEEM